MNPREENQSPRMPDLDELVRYLGRPTLEQHFAQHGTYLDAILPNGKTLGKCTLAEIKEISARYQEMASILGGRTVDEYMNDHWKETGRY